MQRGYSPSPKPAFRNTRSKFFKKKQSDISKASPSHEQNTGDHWKNKGNQAFTKGYFQTAIEHYTKAIELNDGQSIYYSNRAKCYRNMGVIDKALKDAEAACELDDKNIKAHYLCGCILAQASKKDDNKLNKAENRLKKALRLCDTLKKTQFIDSISIKLFRLRKLKYLKQEQSRKQHNKQMYNLIKKSYVEGVIKKQEQDQLMKMQELLNKEKKQQIPDHLLCKITLEVMQEPVTTQAGFTYEKSAFQDHVRTNGMIQPITRQPIKGQAYPNQALKLTIQSFMEENPWAFQHTANQSYHDIEF